MEQKIYKAIADIMGEVGVISKGKKSQQGYYFRGIDDAMNALHPLLSKYHVFVVPEVLEQKREERSTSRGGNLIYSICKIKYVFYAEDGSNIEAVVIGEGMDSGDKATNKAMAIALKYALLQVFCIPTEEMPDPDAETPPESERDKKKESEQKKDFVEKVQRITITEVEEINKEMARTGVTVVDILATAKARFSKEIKELNELTIEQYNYIMNKFKNTPDRR